MMIVKKAIKTQQNSHDGSPLANNVKDKKNKFQNNRQISQVVNKFSNILLKKITTYLLKKIYAFNKYSTNFFSEILL